MWICRTLPSPTTYSSGDSGAGIAEAPGAFSAGFAAAARPETAKIIISGSAVESVAAIHRDEIGRHGNGLGRDMMLGQNLPERRADAERDHLTPGKRELVRAERNAALPLGRHRNGGNRHHGFGIAMSKIEGTVAARMRPVMKVDHGTGLRGGMLVFERLNSPSRRKRSRLGRTSQWRSRKFGPCRRHPASRRFCWRRRWSAPCSPGRSAPAGGKA